ncbi:YoaK family protein [Flavobacterium rakeshii]|uniref:YoaK family protein n=1 Tax=Flavobacterium rakeshii TaxID=1038845 RepID=UPI002E7B42C5|nr:YoaK family protein [Flavobacterium rakeshii]MEE1896956.1 YoaK family protein [Flavobacterium rakeshii]
MPVNSHLLPLLLRSSSLTFIVIIFIVSFLLFLIGFQSMGLDSVSCLILDVYNLMFRNKGKRRTYIHNFRLATILSFVAGIVNISGVLSLGVLTTNVTGHFAFFSEMFVSENYRLALIYVSYISCFLTGAFFSSFIVEMTIEKRRFHSYSIPIITEAVIILITSFFSDLDILFILPYVLLFAMGLQNALVTKVSQSVVRTTHLTGLFTDLGIELSQIIFYRTREERQKLLKSINLKVAIILFFFLGGVIGGVLYKKIELKVLILASIFLLFAVSYDALLLKFYALRKRFRF